MCAVGWIKECKLLWTAQKELDRELTTVIATEPS